MPRLRNVIAPTGHRSTRRSPVRSAHRNGAGRYAPHQGAATRLRSPHAAVPRVAPLHSEPNHAAQHYRSTSQSNPNRLTPSTPGRATRAADVTASSLSTRRIIMQSCYPASPHNTRTHRNKKRNGLRCLQTVLPKLPKHSAQTHPNRHPHSILPKHIAQQHNSKQTPKRAQRTPHTGRKHRATR